MSEIPVNVVTPEDLSSWYSMAKQLEALQASEMLLRKKICNGLFPDPKEGVNSHALPDGYVVKMTHKIDRKLDPAALDTLKQSFRDRGLNPDVLVRYKPELAVTPYKALSPEHIHIFDECLIIKPGAPSMEIVQPASAKAKAK